MEHPYVALLWDRFDPIQSAAAGELLERLRSAGHPWTLRLSGPGIEVLDMPSPNAPFAPMLLAQGRGVLYGRVFNRGCGRIVSAVAISQDEVLSAEDVAARCSALVNDYWGAYVAILTNPRSGDWTIMRDCSGMIPCYRTQAQGIEVFFSDIRYTECILPKLTLSMEYLAAFLRAPHLEIRETGVEQIQELLAGEAHVFCNGKRTIRQAWSPIHASASDSVPDIHTAARHLREATELCISGWAPGFQRIVHSLSGGFDSAIVLGCLLRCANPPEIVCVNGYAEGPAEDERSYARLSASAAGLELTEQSWDVHHPAFDERCLASRTCAKPTISHAVGGLYAAFWDEISLSHRCEAIWTGQGGDHIFLAAKTDLGVVDCRRLHGFGQQLGAAISDSAALTGHSIWHVLSVLAVPSRDRHHTAAARHTFERSPFLLPTTDGLELERYAHHPWFEASRCLPPAKRYQVMQLAEVLNRERPMAGLQKIPAFHPLLSQPLIEAALRIPVHVLLTGGKTRGLARIAFQDLIPAEILHRELKGQVSSHMLRIFHRSKHFISELLLDGLLVQRGLVSRTAIQETLESDRPLRGELYFPLFACLAAEIWTRSWSSQFQPHAPS